MSLAHSMVKTDMKLISDEEKQVIATMIESLKCNIMSIYVLGAPVCVLCISCNATCMHKQSKNPTSLVPSPCAPHERVGSGDKTRTPLLG